MPTSLRQIRPRLEALSAASLEVLRTLEPVVGRIIGTAVLKHACSKAQIDPAQLAWSQIDLLIPAIATSLKFYDHAAELERVLHQLALTVREGGRAL